MRLLGPTAEITDFTSEIIDGVKRKRNDYLVLGTLNVLSYIILIFSFFSQEETEVSYMRWNKLLISG